MTALLHSQLIEQNKEKKWNIIVIQHDILQNRITQILQNNAHFKSEQFTYQNLFQIQINSFFKQHLLELKSLISADNDDQIKREVMDDNQNNSIHDNDDGCTPSKIKREVIMMDHSETHSSKPIKDKTCYFCGVKGHLQHNCPSKPNEQTTPKRRTPVVTNNVNTISVEQKSNPNIRSDKCIHCHQSFVKLKTIGSNARKRKAPYKCNRKQCNETFSNNYTFKQHIISHHSLYKCFGKACGKRFEYREDLRLHKLRCRSYLCRYSQCNATFSSANGRKKHILQMHGKVLSRNKIRKRKRSIKKAIKAIKAKRFQCGICGKALGSLNGLNAHKKCHVAVQPFVCNKCGKRFMKKAQWTKHIEKLCKHTMVIKLESEYNTISFP